MENLKYTHIQVIDWIKTADQKAMILGSFNVAGFIYQLINLDKLQAASIYTVILFFLAITATLIALFIWLRIIYPHLDNEHKKSKIYFQHIANAYHDDVARGIEEMQEIRDDEFEKDLASQIIMVSIVAKKKYANIQRFMWAFGVQISFLILFLVSLYC